MSGTPLRHEGKAIGALIVFRDRLAPFTSEELELQQSFADQAVIAIENARLFNQARQALDRQEAGAEILRTIAAAPNDAEQSLQQVVETTARLFGASSVRIRLVKDGEWGGTFHVGHSSEAIVSAVPEAQARIGGRNLPGTVVTENRQIHIPDLDHIPPEMADWPGLPPARAAGARTVSGTPLRREGKAIGVLVIHRDHLQPFSEEELALQQSFADQAVIAIENARLFNETQEALERQTATADILKVIASSPSDVQPVFEAIVASVKRLFGSFSSTVFLVIDGMAHLKAFTPTTPEADKILKSTFPRPIADFAPFQLTQAGQVMQIPDTEAESSQIRDIAQARGYRSMLFVPLMNKGVSIGQISVTRVQPGTFADHDVQLLQTFADQAVIAIENARLFNETQQALARQTATADILKVIARSPSDVQPVFDAIAERSNTLFGGLSTAVYSLVDNMQHLMAFTPTSPAADAALKSMFPRTVSEVFWSETIRKGEIFRIANAEVELATLPSMRELARLRGWQSALLVPLMRNQTAIGYISVTRAEPGPFTDHDVQLLKTFADQAVIAIENTRLFNETQQALERQTATADILKVIASSPSDVRPVFEAIATRAKTLVGGFSSTVFRFIDGMAHLMAFTPTTPEADEILTSNFPNTLDSFAPFQIGLTGEVAQIPDTESLTNEILHVARAHGFRSMLCAPLMNKGESIGLISVTRTQPGTFADHHVQLLKTFADQAVIAIENTRLFNEVQARTNDLTEALEQQTATSEVLSVISSSAGDLAPVFDTMLAKAMQLCSANFGVLNTYDGKRFTTAATFGLPSAYDEHRRRQSLEYSADTAPARLVQGEPFVEIQDLLDSDAYRRGDANRLALVGLGGARCLLAVPLLKDERVVGNVMIFRQDKRPFSEKQITLLKQFAAQAVIAIENTRLLRELRQSTADLSESLQQQTATADVLKVISRSAFDLQTVLETLISSAVELSGAKRGAIFLRDGELLRYRAASHANQYPDWIKFLQDNPQRAGHHSAIARAITSGQTVCVPDVLADPEIKMPATALANIRAVLAVPLLRDGRVEGMMALSRPTPGPFTDRQIELVQTFADQAVIAIENARLFDEVQERTRELSESLHFQTAASDVLKVISRSPDTLQPVLDVIVETSRELCGSDGATIFLLKERKFHLTAWWGELPSHLEFMLANPVAIGQPGSILNRVLSEKRSLHIPNVMADPELREGSVGIGGPRALLAAPLMRDGEVVGVIILRQSHLKPFTPRQIQAIETFADQAVIAISNVNLFDEVQARTRELAKSLDDLRTAQDRLIQTEKLASLGQLTAGIAHEIKNPLNFVNNFAALSAELTDELKDVLKPAVLDETIRAEVDELTGLMKDNLAKVVQHGKRADSIVKNMLLHSREGSGDHRPADVNALVEESLNLAYHGARAEKPQFNVTLKRDFDPDAGMIEAFPQEITRVLLNLISNGFHAVAKRKAEDGDAAFEPVVSATTKG